jgi:hypothetical protein
MLKLRFAIVVGMAFLSAGCATNHYRHTHTGQLSGRMLVEWMQPDRFLFIPDERRPLKFTRSDGTTIQPERMYTDGGSIPRPLWALRNYSPWGYGPAFMIHDWLFRMQYCELPGWQSYTVDSAAQIMSEVMKSMMESPAFNYGDKTTVYLMNVAVRSPMTRKAWKSRKCEPLPSEAADTWHPSAKFVFDFDEQSGSPPSP